MGRAKLSLWRPLRSLIAGAAALLATAPSPAQDVNYYYYYNTPSMSGVGSQGPFGSFNASRIGRYGLSEYSTPYGSGFTAAGPGFIISSSSGPFGISAGVFGRNGGFVISSPGSPPIAPLTPGYGYPGYTGGYYPNGPSPMTQGFAARFNGQSVQPLTGIPGGGQPYDQVPSRQVVTPTLPPSQEQSPSVSLQPISPPRSLISPPRQSPTSHPEPTSGRPSSLSDRLLEAAGEYSSSDRSLARRWHFYDVDSLPPEYQDEIDGFPTPEFLAISHNGNPDLPGARKFPIYVDPTLDELAATRDITAVYLLPDASANQIRNALGPAIARIDRLLQDE